MATSAITKPRYDDELPGRTSHGMPSGPAAAVKPPPHVGCDRARSYYLQGWRQATTLRLYTRDPKTRKMVGIGYVCRRCGAVRLDRWSEWVIVGPLVGSR